jgi:hypothetical protein
MLCADFIVATKKEIYAFYTSKTLRINSINKYISMIMVHSCEMLYKAQDSGDESNVRFLAAKHKLLKLWLFDFINILGNVCLQ